MRFEVGVVPFKSSSRAVYFSCLLGISIHKERRRDHLMLPAPTAGLFFSFALKIRLASLDITEANFCSFFERRRDFFDDQLHGKKA